MIGSQCVSLLAEHGEPKFFANEFDYIKFTVESVPFSGVLFDEPVSNIVTYVLLATQIVFTLRK